MCSRIKRYIVASEARYYPSSAAGIFVAEMARRHGVNANLLFNWLHEQGLLGARTRAPKPAKLLPVEIAEPVVTEERRQVPGMIEIEWPDKVRVRLRVAGGVSGEQLTVVFNALAQSSARGHTKRLFDGRAGADEKLIAA